MPSRRSAALLGAAVPFILRQEARPRLFFLGRRQRRLIFGVQAGALSIYGSPDAERVLEEYQTDLTEALNKIPTEPGCLPMHAVLDSSSQNPDRFKPPHIGVGAQLSST